MRLPFVLAYIGLVLLTTLPAHATGPYAKIYPGKKVESKSHPAAKTRRLAIHVVKGDWGNADPRDIEKLLYSVAQELWAYFPKRSLKPILVVPAAGNPLTQYEKGPHGEYIVHLSAKDRRWSQYAYQFAHEFAHILSNYDRHGGKTAAHNQWFDEAVCEAASLFTLRRLAESWQLSEEAPPYLHWKEYAPAFERYAEHFLEEAHRRLPAGVTLAAWYREHQLRLRRDPYLREKNELVANILLPLFEENPEYWGAIGYLNLEEEDATGSFEQYLANWYRNAPDQYKPFIEKTIRMFGLQPQTAVAAATSVR